MTMLIDKRLLAIGAMMLAIVLAALIVFPGLRGWSDPVAFAANPASRPPPPMQIGMNLNQRVYWSQEFPFADLVKSSAIKVVTPNGWVDPQGVIALDPGGHPKDIVAGQTLIVMLKVDGGDRVPAGVYDCAISPGWSVKPTGASMAGNGERFVLTVPNPVATGRLSLELTARRAHASLDTLSCRDRAVAAGRDFTPAFLADIQPFAVLRFMDWMSTNGQPPQTWAGRTTPASFSQSSPNGVAVEHMVDLANTANADPWFNMPLEASNDYYRTFATYVRDHLRPDRRVYVEVSNEVWNYGFPQNKRATERGAELYPTATGDDRTDFFYADRVRAVMGIWRDVFRGKEARLVRVLGMQTGNVARAKAALSHLDTVRSVDALAIAPYIMPPSGKPWGSGDITQYLLDNGPQLVDRAMEHAIDSKRVADSFGIRLISYEGGPSYASYNASLQPAFAAADQDPRMYGIYSRFLRRWHDEIGDLFVAFDSVSGNFGHRRYTGQPLSEAPKARALVDFIRKNRLNDGRVPPSGVDR